MSVADDITKAIGQIGDRKFQGVFWRSIGLTFLLLAAFYWGFTLFLGWAIPETMNLPWFGEVTFASAAFSAVALVAMFIFSAFLMFPVASVFIGFFLEEIADAVEDKHYPGLPEVRKVPLVEALVDSLKFLALMVIANLIALIIYLLSTVFAPFVFWAVNGFLLGREYFQLVAMRRMDVKAVKQLRKKHLPEIWLSGVIMAFLLSLPVLNLFVPILAVALFTHQFHRVTGRN